MAHDITIRKASGTWVVRAGGAVIGESGDALAVSEKGSPEVIYFPREDLAMAFLDASETTSHSPEMGGASYFSVVTKSTTLRDVAWSYDAPADALGAIAGYIAFAVSDQVAVEEI